MNPYQSPEEVIQAELVPEVEFPDASWQHVLAGPIIMLLVVAAWITISGYWPDVLQFLAEFIEWARVAS
jgi:hypothetical protein